MGTSPENTLTNFDLDLLLGSASSSLSETTDHGYQFQNVETAESSNSYQVQNLGIQESSDYRHQLQNHEITGAASYHLQNMGSNQHYEHQIDNYYGNTGHVHQAQSLGNELSYSGQTEEVVKKSDYEALKSNFEKLSVNFASLQSKLQSKNKDYDDVKKQYAKLASDFSKLHKENSGHAMGSLNVSAKCEVLEKKEVEYLATIKALTAKCEQCRIEIFAQSNQFVQYQSHVEDLMAQISTLKSNVQSEKNTGRDCRKMISTLTSNNESLMKHLCLFGCIIEGRKQLNKASRRFIKKYCRTSTKTNVESESFENQSVDTGRGSSLDSDGERSFYSPSYTFSPLSAGYVTPRNEHTKVATDAPTSPLPIAVTSDISTSPILFEKATISSSAKDTVEVATNTVICHEDKFTMARVKTRNVATFVAFDDANLVAKKQTMNIATSPVQFDDSSPVANTRTINMATSPVRFDDTSPVAKITTIGVATSPVQFDDSSLVAKTRTLNTATSPVRFDDTSPVAKTRTFNIATSPVQFDDSSPVAKTRTLNTATSPVRLDDTSPVAKTRTFNIATSPVQFDDSSPVAKTRTLNIATSPVRFDDTSPVAKTRTFNIATSPVQFDDTSPVAKTRTLNTATSPVRFDDTSPVAKTKTLAFGTSPVQHPTKKLTDTTRRAIASHVKYPTDTKSIHTEMNQITESRASQNRKQIPELVSKKHVTKTNCHVSQISKRLKEIVSDQANSHIDTENDMEIKMILSRHKMNWDLLSPMSLSPEAQKEAQQENNERDSGSEEHNVEESLAQSLYLSEDEDSDNDRDKEEYHISDLPIENPPQDVNSNDMFDLIKSQVQNENADIVNRNSGDVIYESREEISNQNRVYLNAPSKKRKKLTNLQKIYKANVRKSSIKIDDLPPAVTRKEMDPKPHGISPVKHTVSADKEKGTKPYERNSVKLLHNKQDAVKVSKENITFSYKEPIQLPKDDGKVNIASDCPQRNCPSVSETNKTQSQIQITESISNKCIKTSVIQWNSTCRLPHSQEKPSSEFVQTKVPNSTSTSDLPRTALPKSESMKKRPTKDIKTNNTIVSTHTRTHPQPVSGTKKKCMTETQPSQTNDPIHTQTCLPETEIKQTDSKQDFSKDPPECRTSNPEFDDVGYSYPKPTHKRVSRVKNDITNHLSLQSNQIEISTNDRISNTSDNKLKRPADVINDGLDVKRKRDSSSQKDTTEIDVNMDQSMIIEESVNVSSGESKDKQSEILHVDELNTPDTSDMLSLVKSPNYQIRSCTDYNEMTMFTTSKAQGPKQQHLTEKSWTNNILDRMVYKYGARPSTVKIPFCKNQEAVAQQIKIGIDRCVKCISKPEEYTKTSQQLIADLEILGKQKIVTGMMKYLNDPAQKSDFIIGTVKFQKKGLTCPTASNAEMALIDVIQSLDKSGTVPWDFILDGLEFTLFNLERGATPGFDVIESLAHFYANICRYQRNVSRMWMFMLNAMYCLTFKAIPIIKHCLDVMPEVLPYSSTYLGPGLAPMIRCLVFLLNFYSCDKDPFNRMDAIRRLLKYKYYYNMQDENETTLLFLLKQSIGNLTDNKLERDMLELSFLIVAKRKGTKWCHKNLVQKIILPMIKGDSDVSYRAKRFCITTIGHLMKPYNNEMTVHTEEVVNMLINMFEQESQTHEMKEDIIRGLLNLNMSTLSVRINACLFKWNPPSVSSELEEALQIYVHRKNMKSWHAAYKNYYREF